MKTLTIAGLMCSLVALFFFPAAFTLLAMTLGLTVLAKGKLEHGLTVIVFAGACGYYGMATWKPLDSFAGEHVPVQGWFDSAAQLPPGTEKDWRLVSLQTRVVNSSDADPVCEWKLVVRNDALRAQVFHGSIDFQDAHGVTLFARRVNGYQVPAGTLGIFTGSVPVRGGTRVARAVPQLTAGG